MDTPKQKALHIITQMSDGSSWQDIFDTLQKEKSARHTNNDSVDWERLVRQVRTVLYDEFPDAKTLKLDVDHEGQHVSGFIVAQDFEGMEDADRQDRVWDALEKGLSVDEQSRILSVIALTPTEGVAQGVSS
ncbi:hypothetical protein DCC62_02695 [candidate division KSB1 bacterium]|nr:MAG: hypothetical protein DCC62_02695 [candidate division KSB1 bacterium]